MQGSLSWELSLQLVAILIKSCEECPNPEIQLWFCRSAAQTLSAMKDSVSRKSLQGQRKLREDIGSAYYQLAKVAARLDDDLVEKWNQKAEKWAPGLKPESKESSKTKKWTEDIATVSATIFPRNTRPPVLPWTCPEVYGPVKGTPELVASLTLLQQVSDRTLHTSSLDVSTRQWLEEVDCNEDERLRLKKLARQLNNAFIKENFKDREAVAEIVVLAPVLEKEDFKRLLGEFLDVLSSKCLLNLDILAGLAQLIKNAPLNTLDSKYLVTILPIVSSRLQENARSQANSRVHTLVVAVSDILSAMADRGVSELDKVELHEPLLNFLVGLWDNPDPHIVYHARTAYQALLCISDNEPLWKARIKGFSNFGVGAVGVASEVKSLDAGSFFESLERLQEEFSRADEIFRADSDLMTSLKEGFKRRSKEPWYSALRVADEFLEQGELADFRELVCMAPFRRDQWFLWGVCERLGNLAANKQSIWDSKDQHGAILFLCEIYKDDSTWGDQPDLKKHILDILQQLSLPTIDVPEARAFFYALSTDGDSKKQGLYEQCKKTGPSDYHVKTGTSQFAIPSLLDRVQWKTDVNADLQRLARKKAGQMRDVYYIPPRSKDNLQAPDETTVDLEEVVADFLKSDRKVLLLLGDSGVGKTTFIRFLEVELWFQYIVMEESIPLLINLSTIERPESDLIPKQLRILNFRENQIWELRHRHFILICEGYDESQQVKNLYISNHFDQPDQWKVQMIISCRTEYLPTDYQGRFEPGDKGSEKGQSLFQQAVVSPFNDAQIRKYIEKYVNHNVPPWKLSDYYRVMEKIPSLQELLKNPFLLSIALWVLPRLADPGQYIEAEKITRVRVYDEFIAHWLERGRKKLEEDKDLSYEQKKAFQSLCNDGFVQSGMDFIKDLAVFIFEEQQGNTIVEYSKKIDRGSRKDRFFSLDDEASILCEVCPLDRTGNQIQFIHRSFLEYGLSLAIFDPALEQEAFGEPEPSPSLKRRGSTASQFSFEANEHQEDILGTEKLDRDSPIFKRSYLKEKSIIQLLVERVQQDTTGGFRKRLVGYITASAQSQEWRTAAANAITVLVRAGVCFSHQDLRGIRIPGADLSFAVFDSTQLQEADLRGTNLQGAWLRNANLDGARMEGAQFGEWPALTHKKMEGAFAYSPDGKLLMALTEEGVVMYHTLAWTLAPLPTSIQESEAKITAFAFSPDSSIIAAGRDDNSVVVWTAKEGMMVTTLKGHAGLPRDVAFPPEKSHQFATCSNDSRIRLWDRSLSSQGAGDWKAAAILWGHSGPVMKVRYDKTGDILVSCSKDGTVRVFNLSSRATLYTFKHPDQVVGISFHPENTYGRRQIYSFALDHIIRLWNIDTGICDHTLSGHTATIRAVSFSPKGNFVVSSSADKTIKVWRTSTGQLLNTIQVHDEVSDVVYSPDGLQIAAACDDNTVRLWNSEEWTAPGMVLSGHSGAVERVSYAPDGSQLASNGQDGSIRLWVSVTSSQQRYRRHRFKITQILRLTGGKYILSRCKDSVRIWDDATGSLRHSLVDQRITVMAMSPCGLQFATASSADNTIKLWEPQNGQCKFTLKAEKDSKQWWTGSSSLWGNKEWVTDIAYSSDGCRLASGSLDGIVRIWNWRDGTLMRLLYNNNRGTHLVFSPAGSGLLASADCNIVLIWNVMSGERVHTLCGDSSIEKIAFSSEGDSFIADTADGVFRTWKIQTAPATSPQQTVFTIGDSPKKPIGEIKGCSGRTVVAYSPDGRFLVHCAESGLLILWDIAKGKEAHRFKTLTSRITCLDWSFVDGMDQTKITVGHEEGDVSVWSFVEAVPAATDNVAAHQKYDLLLLWTSANKRLNVEGMSVNGVKGLSRANIRLLQQNDARGEPESLCKKTQKDVMMSEVISNFKNSTPVEE
ncbi:hypothetical protein EMPS_08523 [Entomortierella parvispora]|uniref:WD40 repeat-like protein n=1 Tax=Entomortierella parvispora TaxID=205924 RepID=A0A9P3LZD3_9FUNG|nr:hypothetical protein EMPS_08523 [Entomortierella parvispora]